MFLRCYYSRIYLTLSIKFFFIAHASGTIGAPSFLNISIKCDGILFKWVGPDLLPGFEVLGYLLEIEGTNITNTTVNVTDILITYDGLEYNEAYNVSLSALYCNGNGNETIGTFFTAMGM